jgi:DivIVA domain-containing protein
VLLTPAGVRNVRFATTRRRPGYDVADVDAFLRRLEYQVDVLTETNDALRAMLEQVRHGGRRPDGIAPPALRLTVDDVRRVVFKTTRLRPGYDEQEVDSFLDRAEAGIGELVSENDELRAELSVA